MGKIRLLEKERTLKKTAFLLLEIVVALAVFIFLFTVLLRFQKKTLLLNGEAQKKTALLQDIINERERRR